MSVNRRECSVCGKVKPRDRYHTAGVKKGKRYLRRQCKKCYGKGKRHRRTFNRDWLANYKSVLACSGCGYSKATHPTFKTQALEFHHIKGKKEFAVSNGVHRGMALARIKKEIAKCVVLCTRCHAEIHFD